MEHTATPWKTNRHMDSGDWVIRDADDWIIANCYDTDTDQTPPLQEANATFIVQCCNHHDALVEALTDLLTAWHFQMDAYKEMPVETRAKAILDKIEKGE